MHGRRREAQSTGDDVRRSQEHKSAGVAEGGFGVGDSQISVRDFNGGSLFPPIEDWLPPAQATYAAETESRGQAGKSGLAWTSNFWLRAHARPVHL